MAFCALSEAKGMVIKMRKVMVRAWEIAKEGQKKFGGSAREYFRVALKMAWAETRRSAKAILVTSCGSRKHKSWVAKIVGTHARYGLDRVFVEHVEENWTEKHFELEAGYYEVCDGGERRFIVVSAGEIATVGKHEIMAVVA